MIIEIRNQLKSQGFKIVLWVTLIAMALLFSPALFRQQSGIRSAIATVNNYPIELLPFERKVAQETERLQFFREQFGKQAEEYLQSLDPRSIALQAMIQDELLNQVGDDLGIRISPDYIVQILQNPSLVRRELQDVVPLYLLDEEQKNINTNRLNQYLNRYRLSITDFDKNIENKLKRSTVLSLVGASTYVSPQDLKEYYMENRLGKTFLVATFPFDQFLNKAKNVQPTQEELAAFFEKFHKKYWTPEKRSGFLWEFSPESYQVTVADSEAEGYYHNHKVKKYVDTPLQLQVKRILIKINDNADSDTIKAAEERAKEIKQELANNPSEFDALAKKYSDDKKTASKGGLTEFFKRGDKDPEFEKAAFRLQKDGDISDILVTDEGFEILQRVARKPVTYKPFSLVKSDIVAELNRQKFKNLFTEDMSRFMNRSSAGDLIRPFALDKKATSRTIELQENDNSPIMEKLFKTRAGDWAFFVHNNKGYALNVTKIEKSHKPELSSVEKNVRNDFFIRKAQEIQKETIQNAKKIAKDQSFDQVKNEFSASINSYGPFKKTDKESGQNIPLKEMLSLGQPGSLGIAFDDKNTAYLIKVDSVEAFNEQAFNEQKESINKELYAEQQGTLERGFVASLYRNATLHFIESRQNQQEENLPYE